MKMIAFAIILTTMPLLPNEEFKALSEGSKAFYALWYIAAFIGFIVCLIEGF